VGRRSLDDCLNTIVTRACVGGRTLSALPADLFGRIQIAVGPADPAFIGSEQLILVSMWSHFTHSKVRTSYPEGPGMMKENIMRF
jgi:hypothetical protein